MTITTIGADPPAGAHLFTDVAGGATAEAASAGRIGAVSILPPPIRELAGARTAAFASMPASSGFVPRLDTFPVPSRGYAAASGLAASKAPAAAKASTAAQARPAAKASVAAQPASTAFTSKELSFLQDKKLSIEEKLFRFMALLIQKGDQQLVDAMKAYAGKTASTGTSSSSSSSGGSKSPGGTSGGSGGGLDLKALAGELGGPALAALATVFGVPELAPVAMKVGGVVAQGAVTAGETAVDFIGSLFGGGSDGSIADALSPPIQGVMASAPGVAPAPSAGSPASAAATVATAGPSSSASTAGASEMDEKLMMLNLQRMVEKQNAMFSALSNVLKAIHDGQMTAVQNIR